MAKPVLNVGDRVWHFTGEYSCPRVTTVIKADEPSEGFSRFYEVAGRYPESSPVLCAEMELFRYPDEKEALTQEMLSHARHIRLNADELQWVEADHLDYYSGLTNECGCQSCQARETSNAQ